ncbi:HAUS augmin-like complex subunit 3 isoform X2 [Stegodyphus dumicola]|uniref:HAUS augmin-like complex subunit 3 isoform X2 n=1 Tax=Stegodyphus dumicola TaxID=202533 RepID=UPI0015A799ED|nr:HAUS augmin-like complex subunit 3 isoform X2 [Stegodyphus dumicola]
MMSYGRDFLKTLKRLDVPNLNKYEDSDFDPMFNEKNLISFLQCFCSLTQDNVLTPEEIAEYSSLSPAELARYEILLKTEDVQYPEKFESEKREIKFLEEHLSQIESHNKILENQKELAKQYEEHLYQEKEACAKVLHGVRCQFQDYSVSKVPKLEAELLSAMRDISNIVQELKSLLIECNNVSKTTLANNIEQYLRAEKDILDPVKAYLQKEFQCEEGVTFSLKIPERTYLDELKQVQFLQKALKTSKASEVDAIVESKKLETTLRFYENYKEFFQNLNISSVALEKKFDNVLVSNIKLQKEEKELKLYLSDIISQEVDVQCCRVSTGCKKEMLRYIQYNEDKLQPSMEALENQRTRLEYLVYRQSMSIRNLVNLKQLMKQTSNLIEKEHAELLNRKVQYQEKINKCHEKSEYLSENSIFVSLYKILTHTEDLKKLDMSHVHLDDVLNAVLKFHKETSSIDEHFNENLKAVDSIV